MKQMALEINENYGFEGEDDDKKEKMKNGKY